MFRSFHGTPILRVNFVTLFVSLATNILHLFRRFVQEAYHFRFRGNTALSAIHKVGHRIVASRPTFPVQLCFVFQSRRHHRPRRRTVVRHLPINHVVRANRFRRSVLRTFNGNNPIPYRRIFRNHRRVQHHPPETRTTRSFVTMGTTSFPVKGNRRMRPHVSSRPTKCSFRVPYRRRGHVWHVKVVNGFQVGHVFYRSNHRDLSLSGTRRIIFLSQVDLFRRFSRRSVT